MAKDYRLIRYLEPLADAAIVRNETTWTSILGRPQAPNILLRGPRVIGPNNVLQKKRKMPKIGKSVKTFRYAILLTVMLICYKSRSAVPFTLQQSTPQFWCGWDCETGENVEVCSACCSYKLLDHYL